ncbi:hypothetical protein DL765_005510 [Monosporascus sp. GIB2]|nr:hypothetical protein DL765_005510 [Monosporascus sp. GIB2]
MMDIYTLAALQKAVECVGAVIHAYYAHPEAVVDGQLLLLRGAGRWARKREHQLDHQVHSRLHGHHPRVGAGPLRPTQDARLRGGGRAVPRRQGKALMWTSVDDLAAYTIEAVSGPGAANGGFYRVQSFRASPLEVVEYGVREGLLSHFF